MAQTCVILKMCYSIHGLSWWTDGKATVVFQECYLRKLMTCGPVIVAQVHCNEGNANVRMHVP